MKLTRDVLVCKSCDVGIYARVLNEKNIECDCGKCNIDAELEYQVSEDSIHLSYTNASVLSKDDPIQGVDYDAITLPLRTTQDKLDLDYDLFNDRFGKIRNASKAIPTILKMDGKPLVLVRRHYEDYVSDLIEDDIEKTLELKENDLTIC